MHVTGVCLAVHVQLLLRHLRAVANDPVTRPVISQNRIAIFHAR